MHFRQELASKITASRLRSGNELRSHQEDDQRRVASKLAVAFTCRQLYLEVTPIYYRENKFHLPWWGLSHRPSRGLSFRFNCDNFKEFAEAIGSVNAASILSLRLDGYTIFDEYHTYFPSLERLEFALHPLWHCYNRDWLSGMISYVQKHPSTVVTFNGKVCGLQEWVSYAEEAGITGNW